MNTKLVISYTTSLGIKGEVTEYHMNRQAAYAAQETIMKRLGHGVKIDKVSLSPVLKHLELVVETNKQVSDTKYTEVK